MSTYQVIPLNENLRNSDIGLLFYDSRLEWEIQDKNNGAYTLKNNKDQVVLVPISSVALILIGGDKE